MEIFLLSKEHDASIDIEWIPRSENEVADYLSKIVDFDDWCVKDSYFRAVDSNWGPFTVECFANSVNAKASRFYSLFFSTWVFVCTFFSLRLGIGKLLDCSPGLFNSSCFNAFS